MVTARARLLVFTASITASITIGCEAREPMHSLYEVRIPVLEVNPPIESVLQLRIHNDDEDPDDRDNRVDLCLLRHAAPMRVATMAFEKDAFDAYHLKVSALDSALNEDVLRAVTLAALPTSQLGGITPFETALLSSIDRDPYALRFCRPEPDGLRCKSLLGRELALWRKVDERPAEACRPIAVCSATSDLGLSAGQLACLGTSDTSLCEQVLTATPRKLVECLAAGAETPMQLEVDARTLREGCDRIDETLRAGQDVVTMLTDECMPSLPAPLETALARLCQAVQTVTPDLPVDQLLTQTTRVCAESGQVYDFVARCCTALVPDADPPGDAGVDAGVDAPIDAPSDAASACSPTCPLGQLCCADGQRCCSATQFPACCD